jgi:hypothetical protein
VTPGLAGGRAGLVRLGRDERRTWSRQKRAVS